MANGNNSIFIHYLPWHFYDLLIDFNDMSTCLVLFYAYILRCCVHWCLYFLCSCFLRVCGVFCGFLFLFLLFLLLFILVFYLFVCFFTRSYQIQIILNRFSRVIDGTLTSTTTPAQGGPGSHGNEGILHTPQNWSVTIRFRYPDYLFFVGGGSYSSA